MNKPTHPGREYRPTARAGVSVKTRPTLDASEAEPKPPALEREASSAESERLPDVLPRTTTGRELHVTTKIARRRADLTPKVADATPSNHSKRGQGSEDRGATWLAAEFWLFSSW